MTVTAFVWPRGRVVSESGRAPAFFMTWRGGNMSAIQADIEARLAESEPDVEVLFAEVVGGRLVRLFIDHPQGVSLALCERVTGHLAAVSEKYALAVSSPGADRPLSKPEHFRRYVGHRARVRTLGDHQSRHTFTGELVVADEDAV